MLIHKLLEFNNNKFFGNNNSKLNKKLSKFKNFRH